MAETVAVNQKPDDVYVRKDVFDARMDRMEMLLEKTVIEIKSYIDNSISEMKAENAKFRDEMRAENAKFRDEIKAENAKFRDEMRAENAEFRDEIKIEISGLKSEIGELRTETGAEISSLKSEIGELRTETRAEIRDVRNEVRLLSTRIDSLENVFYWGLGGYGIILASAVLLPVITSFVKKLFQPSITVEDVERMINAAIRNQLSANMEGRQS